MVSLLKVTKAEMTILKEKLNRLTNNKREREDEIRRKIKRVTTYENFKEIRNLKWLEDVNLEVETVSGDPLGDPTREVAIISG